MNDNKSQLLNAGITYVPKNGMGKNTNEFFTFSEKKTNMKMKRSSQNNLLIKKPKFDKYLLALYDFFLRIDIISSCTLTLKLDHNFSVYCMYYLGTSIVC